MSSPKADWVLGWVDARGVAKAEAQRDALIAALREALAGIGRATGMDDDDERQLNQIEFDLTQALRDCGEQP